MTLHPDVGDSGDSDDFDDTYVHGINSKADLFCRRSVAAVVAMVWAVVASAAEMLPS